MAGAGGGPGVSAFLHCGPASRTAAQPGVAPALRVRPAAARRRAVLREETAEALHSPPGARPGAVAARKNPTAQTPLAGQSLTPQQAFGSASQQYAFPSLPAQLSPPHSLSNSWPPARRSPGTTPWAGEMADGKAGVPTAILIMVADRMLRKLSLPFLAPTRHKNRYCGSFPLRVWLVSTTVRA